MPTLEEYTSYVFGESLQQLDPKLLPKEIDVLRFIVHCFDVSRAEVPRMDKKKRNAAVIKKVLGAVSEIWKNKSLLIRSSGAIYWLVNSLVDKVDFVRVSKKNHEFDVNWIQQVFQQHNKIFDIAEKPAKDTPSAEAMDIDVPELPGTEQEEEGEVLPDRKRKAPKPFGFDEVILKIFFKIMDSKIS